MRTSLVSFSSSLAALALLSFASVASAQEAKTAAAAADPGDDHDAVVGHFGVGYFGISNLPIGGGGGAGGVTTGTLPAPVIGMRYWLLPKLAIDAGVGFSDSNLGWGVAAHAGVPIALASARHMTFELIPEATVAFAGNSAGAISYSGFLLDIGARIGGEIQFGFMGIPQLSLVASVGVLLEHESYGFSTNATSGSTSTTTFTTTVGSDPWGIFTDSISAIYYF